MRQERNSFLEETPLSKSYIKFLKMIDKLKKEGKCFDLFEIVMNESSIVYADSEKNYAIVKKEMLDQYYKKLLISKNTC